MELIIMVWVEHKVPTSLITQILTPGAGQGVQGVIGNLTAPICGLGDVGNNGNNNKIIIK